ncbi:hypothetical protein ACFLYQ_00910 [Chloroflexota bacterium]
MSEIGIISPSQVDSSMLNTIVKVRGEVIYAIENPAELGGMHLKLGDSDSDGEGEVDVRIQDDIWQTYDDDMKDGFRQGRIVTAEGVLFRAGEVFVVIHGKYSLSSNATSPASD